MEILSLKSEGIKIKTADLSIFIDPVNIDEKLFLPTDLVNLIVSQDGNRELDFEKIPGKKLLIEGPGEYEIEGAQVNGQTDKKGLYYTITVDNIKILLTSSLSLASFSTEDEYDILLLKVDSQTEIDNLSSVNAKMYILYGNLDKTAIKENVEIMNKINIKRKIEIEEQKKIIFLS